MYAAAIPNMQVMRMPTGTANPFTVVSNDEMSFTRDSRLTSSAKGILYTVLTLCEQSWHFSVKGLCSLMKDSETKIRTALKELKKFGYYVTEKIKDEKGRYLPTKYYFYESSQLNGNEDAGEKNGLFSSPCPRLDFPHVDCPDVDFVAQSNTDTIKYECSNVSQSVGGQTDGENQNEQTVPEISELEIMFAGTTNPFVLEVKRYLAEMISTGIINRKKTVSSEELLQKMWTVYTEYQLPVFLEKLETVCTKSLKNLKCTEAKDSYLKSVIAEFALKYNSENQKPANQKEEQSGTLSFREMMTEMHYPDTYILNSEIFDSEEAYFNENPDDTEELQMCIIPDSFRKNPEIMEKALKVLGGYHHISGKGTEYRLFADETYRSLAKILCTGKAGKNSINVESLLCRLNEINADASQLDDSIGEFVQTFYRHFREKVSEYSDISNKKAYREVMLASFLDGEYQEMNIRIEMILNDDSKKKQPEILPEYFTAEPTDTAETVSECVTELFMGEVCSHEEAVNAPETAVEQLVEEVGEEQAEPEHIMTKEEEETLLKSLFGEDISDEKLKWLMCGGTYEYTEKPTEEPQETELPEEEIKYLNDIIENKRRTVTFEK